MLELIATYALAGSGINWVYKNIREGKLRSWYSQYADSQDDPWARLPMLFIHNLLDCSFCTALHLTWISLFVFGHTLFGAILLGLGAAFLAELISWIKGMITLWVMQANGTIKQI